VAFIITTITYYKDWLKNYLYSLPAAVDAAFWCDSEQFLNVIAQRAKSIG
jgi:hypothetical protein